MPHRQNFPSVEELTELLHEAVTHEDLEVARFYLNKGADPNAADSNGESPFVKAVLKKCPDLVRLMLNYNPDITGALRRAFLAKINSNPSERSVEFDILNLILYHGMRYQDPRLSNYYILCDAILRDDWRTVYLCISPIEDVNFHDLGSVSPLEMAVAFNRLHIAEILLRRGADPDQNLALNVESVLLHAIYLDYPGMLMLLLKHDAEVNFVDFERDYGMHLTPLTTAILISNDCNLMRILLVNSKGQIDVNGWSSIGNDEVTPLDIACELGQLNSVKLLIAFGARVNLVDRDGDSPLHRAIGHLEIMKYLLKRGAKVNAVNLRGQTPLHLTCQAPGFTEETLIEIAKVLIEYGGDLTAWDQDGRSVAHYASDTPELFIYIVDQILDLGFSINERFPGGQTLLHSIPLTHCYSFEELLKRGADINIQSDDGAWGDHVHTCNCQVGDIVNRLKYIGYDVVNRGTITHMGFIIADDRFEDFQQELERLADAVIAHNPVICLDDLLFMNLNTLEKYAANENWIRVYESCNRDFESVYPLYGGLMNFRYRKVVARRDRMEKVKLCLYKVTGDWIPDYCMQKMCKYLTDRDLQIFIDKINSLDDE